MKALTQQQQALKEQFTRTLGYWHPFWDGLLSLDEDFFSAFLEMAAVPWTTGILEPKVKEFISIAVNASTTHLYEPALRVHMRNALQHGASGKEVLEVLELVSALGIHTCMVGIPVLSDELRKAGSGAEIGVAFTPEQEALKAGFIEKRGYWAPVWEEVLGRSPEFFKTYLRFSSHPWTAGVLSPKVKELVYIAIDVSATHLYEPGLRFHIQNAMKYGATVPEILEVYQLVSTLGIHTATLGVPMLVEELERAGMSL